MKVVLKRGMNIGAMSAEDDDNFLENCIVSTSDLNRLSDPFDPKCGIWHDETETKKSNYICKSFYPKIVLLNKSAHAEMSCLLY